MRTGAGRGGDSRFTVLPYLMKLSSHLAKRQRVLRKGDSKISQRKPHKLSRLDEPAVVACNRDGLPLRAQEVGRSEVQSVEGPYRFREGFERTSENRYGHLKHPDAPEEPLH